MKSKHGLRALSACAFVALLGAYGCDIDNGARQDNRNVVATTGVHESSAGKGQTVQSTLLLTPESIGRLHNQAMAHVDSVVPCSPSTPLAEKDRACSKALIRFATTRNLELDSAFAEDMYRRIRERMGPPSGMERLRTTELADSLLSKLLTAGNVVSVEEKRILLDMFRAIEQSRNGSSSSSVYSDIKSAIASARADIENLVRDVPKNQGLVALSAVSVATNSLEYWYHYRSDSLQPQAIPVWVGVDVCGGLLGACTVFWDDYLRGDGKVSWGSAAGSFVFGAAATSIGRLKVFT